MKEAQAAGSVQIHLTALLLEHFVLLTAAVPSWSAAAILTVISSVC